MVDLSTVATVLVAVVPTVSAICSILCGAIVLGKKIKNTLKKCEDDSTEKITKVTNKLNKAYDDISVMKSKMISIEKRISEDYTKRR